MSEHAAEVDRVNVGECSKFGVSWRGRIGDEAFMHAREPSWEGAADGSSVLRASKRREQLKHKSLERERSPRVHRLQFVSDSRSDRGDRGALYVRDLIEESSGGARKGTGIVWFDDDLSRTVKDVAMPFAGRLDECRSGAAFDDTTGEAFGESAV